LLGSQFRAVIQYAASNPQTETIFLNYACSGAEISGNGNAPNGGILTPYTGTMEHSTFVNDKKKEYYDESWYKNLSQINRAIIDICAEPNYAGDKNLSTNTNIQAYIKDYEKDNATFSTIACKKLKRDIDAVLLSVGGNDVGFSKVIFNATAEDWLTRIGLWWKKRIATPEEAKELAKKELSDRYQILADRFRDDLQIKNPSRIIIMQYPNPTGDESGNFCGHNREEHNKAHTLHPRLFFEGSSPAYVEEKDSKDIANIMIPALNGAIEKATKKHGWTLAKAPDFSGHGWCATGEYKENPEDDLGLPENFCSYNPYANVTRSLRTVNDSKLTQHAFQTETDLEHGEAMLAKNFYSINGFFHPNHLGSAAIADVYLKKLTEVLNKDKNIPKKTVPQL
jgi:lysophospholipase L1-like esterase